MALTRGGWWFVRKSKSGAGGEGEGRAYVGLRLGEANSEPEFILSISARQSGKESHGRINAVVVLRGEKAQLQ